MDTGDLTPGRVEISGLHTYSRQACAPTPSSVFSAKYFQRYSPATLNDAVRAVYTTGTALVTLVYGHLRVVELGSQEASFCAMGVIGVRLPAWPVNIHSVDKISEWIIVIFTGVFFI